MGLFERFLSLEYWASVLMAVPAVIIGLTFHEYAHAWTANKLGDPTAKAMGRLTFNPLRHLSVIGTICFLLFRFGWAKPVPINPANFEKPRRGIIITSIAGPTGSLIIAVAFAILARLLSLFLPPDPSSLLSSYVYSILVYGTILNILFFFFNLIPIPPLDGSQILFNLLPARYANVYQFLQRFGFFILIGFIVLFRGIFWLILGTPTLFLSHLLVGNRILSIIQSI